MSSSSEDWKAVLHYAGNRNVGACQNYWTWLRALEEWGAGLGLWDRVYLRSANTRRDPAQWKSLSGPYVSCVVFQTTVSACYQYLNKRHGKENGARDVVEIRWSSFVWVAFSGESNSNQHRNWYVYGRFCFPYLSLIHLVAENCETYERLLPMLN